MSIISFSVTREKKNLCQNVDIALLCFVDGVSKCCQGHCNVRRLGFCTHKRTTGLGTWLLGIMSQIIVLLMVITTINRSIIISTLGKQKHTRKKPALAKSIHFYITALPQPPMIVRMYRGEKISFPHIFPWETTLLPKPHK